MSKYGNTQDLLCLRWQYAGLVMFKFGNTKFWLCLNMAIRRDGYVKIWKYPGLVMSKYGNT